MLASWRSVTKIAGSGSRIWIQDPDPDTLVRGMDPRIRIHTKMSWIRNTAFKTLFILTDGVNSVPDWIPFSASSYKVLIKLIHSTIKLGQQYKLSFQDYILRDLDWMTPMRSVFKCNRKWFHYILLFNSDGWFFLTGLYWINADRRFRNRCRLSKLSDTWEMHYGCWIFWNMHCKLFFDEDSLDPDPDPCILLNPDPDPIRGFWWQKSPGDAFSTTKNSSYMKFLHFSFFGYNFDPPGSESFRIPNPDPLIHPEHCCTVTLYRRSPLYVTEI